MKTTLLTVRNFKFKPFLLEKRYTNKFEFYYLVVFCSLSLAFTTKFYGPDHVQVNCS